MKICIIGAGNAGCAHAFKFTEFGHEVRLVKTSHSLHDDYFNHIVKDSTIHAIDHTLNSRESYQKISMITRDMEKGINGADIVLVMTQSLQHDELAPRVAPLLIEGQMVMLIPGNMGSFIFKKIAPKGVIIGEGESTLKTPLSGPSIWGLPKNIRGRADYSDFNTDDLGFQIHTGVSGIGSGIVRMGWPASMALFFTYFTMIMGVKTRSVRNALMLLYLWDYLLYSGVFIFSYVQTILLVLTIVYAKYTPNSHKPPLHAVPIT